MKVVLLVLALALTANALSTSPPPQCSEVVLDDPINTNIAAPEFTGGDLNNNGVVLNFVVSPKYSQVIFDWSSGGGANPSRCYFDTAGGSFYSYWTYSADPNNCNANATISATFPTSAAANVNPLGSCFHFDNTSNPNFVLYTTTVIVTSIADRPSIRGDNITRTVVTAFQLAYRFQRYINISSSNIHVSGTAQVAFDLIANIFDPVTRKITLEAFTSVQPPYEIAPLDGNTVDYVITDTNTQVSYTIPVTPFQNNGSCDGQSVCNQYWTATIQPADGLCTFHPTFTFMFKIQCASEYVQLGFSCDSVPGNPTFNATFDLTLTNYCVQVVETIGLAGTLKPYIVYPIHDGNNQLPPTQLNYLYGQTIFFRADVWTTANSQSVSTVQIDNTEFVTATVNAPQLTTVFTPASTIGAGNANIQFHYFNNIDSTTSSGFSFNAVSDVLPTTSVDSADTVAVSATFRVSYVNLNGANTRALYSSKNVNIQAPVRMFADGGFSSTTLNAEFSVTRPLTSSTSTSSLVPAVAAAAAGVALLTVFVAFVLYRRRTTDISKTQRTPPESKEESNASSA